MCCVLAAPGFWQREEQFGIEWRKVLHGEQSVTIHRPLPIAGDVRSVLTTEAVYDKGDGKGALIYTVRKLFEKSSGELLATVRQGSFLRGNGGQGGLTDGAPKPHPIPDDRAADIVLPLQTRPEQGLIYRLSGDYNPLHADPAAAKASGFTGPILHGLASYGVVCRALISALCGDDANRLKRADVRFSSPVYPGDTIITEIWRDGPGKASFRARVDERDVLVINNGYAEYE
jgi:acyl dehydratase